MKYLEQCQETDTQSINVSYFKRPPMVFIQYYSYFHSLVKGRPFPDDCDWSEESAEPYNVAVFMCQGWGGYLRLEGPDTGNRHTFGKEASINDQIINILDFVSLVVSVTTTRLCCNTVETVIKK